MQSAGKIHKAAHPAAVKQVVYERPKFCAFTKTRLAGIRKKPRKG